MIESERGGAFSHTPPYPRSTTTKRIITIKITIITHIFILLMLNEHARIVSGYKYLYLDFNIPLPSIRIDQCQYLCSSTSTYICICTTLQWQQHLLTTNKGNFENSMRDHENGRTAGMGRYWLIQITTVLDNKNWQFMQQSRLTNQYTHTQLDSISSIYT